MLLNQPNAASQADTQEAILATLNTPATAPTPNLAMAAMVAMAVAMVSPMAVAMASSDAAEIGVKLMFVQVFN